MSDARIYETEHGPLRVSPMREELVDLFGTKWPAPIATLLPREDAQTAHNRAATFILPFEYEGRQVKMIYLAQAPRAVERARVAAATTQAQADRFLLAAVRGGFKGTVVQVTSVRESQGVGVPGLGLVVTSAPELGGANPLRLLLDLVQQGDLEFDPVADPTFVPSGVAGELSLGYGLIDGRLPVCFHPELDPADPALARLVAGGVQHLYHMPVTGTAFPKLGARVELPRVPAAERVEDVSPNGRSRIYRLLANLAACDGQVDPQERALLNGLAERLGLGATQVAILEEEGFAGRGLTVGRNPVERELLMLLLIEMSFADGVLDREEKRRLKAFADKIGIPRDELRRRLDERAQRSQSEPQGGDAGEVATPPDALRRIYRLMCLVAASDGEIGKEEDQVLGAFCLRYGLSAAEAFALREEALRGEQLAVGGAPGEREALLDALIEITVADGVVTQAESRNLRAFCEALQVPVDALERRLHARMRADAAAPSPSLPPPPTKQEDARLILLDVPTSLIGINLLRLPIEPGFKGFRFVEPGVHRISVSLDDGREVSHWVRLVAGQTDALAFDGSAWVRPPADRVEEVQSGALDEHLNSFPVHLPWRNLTAPLQLVSFPPVVFEATAEAPATRLESALVAHGGRTHALLAELAHCFLVALLDRDQGHHRRWVHLLQGLYCGGSFGARAPKLLEWAVDLLIEQHRQLPQEILGSANAITRDSHFLSEDLIESGIPELVEAGRRWAVFVAGHHAGAPPAEALPQSMTDPRLDPESPFAQGLQENQAELERTVATKGPAHKDLLPLYSFRSQIQEFAGDLLGALESQERLIEVGLAVGSVPAAELAKGFMRLARLNRVAGRADAARVAEREAQRLALSARLN